MPRSSVFVTSKLPAEVKSSEGAQQMFEQTMSALALEQLDLYLIHAPDPRTPWRTSAAAAMTISACC